MTALPCCAGFSELDEEEIILAMPSKGHYYTDMRLVSVIEAWLALRLFWQTQNQMNEYSLSIYMRDRIGQ